MGGVLSGMIILMLSYTYTAVAQSPITPPNGSIDTSKVNFHKQLDGIDILKTIFRIRINEKPDTALKVGKLYLAAFPSVGYTLEAHWLGVISANASFYTANPKTTNLSTVETTLEYSVKNQVVVPVISSIWLGNNNINILADYRYYYYPSSTYGLGGQTSINNGDEINYSYMQFYQEALYKLAPGFYGGAGYDLDYHFNIKDETEPVSTNFTAYNGIATSAFASGPVLHIKYDTRDNINYPKDAIYASLTFRDNLTALGSDNNWQSLSAEYRQYLRFNKHTQNVLALWSWNTFTFGHAPYFDLPSTGWDTYNNTGRGYIQSRYRGNDLLYAEAEYRFGITHNGLLGGVVFVNAESASGISTVINGVPSYIDPNKFSNIAPGYGLGLRIKVNKFSNTNLCVDYGFGNGGSHGFFFNLGELF